MRCLAFTMITTLVSSGSRFESQSNQACNHIKELREQLTEDMKKYKPSHYNKILEEIDRWQVGLGGENSSEWKMCNYSVTTLSSQ